MNANHYETTVVLHPSLGKAEVKKTLDKYTKLLKQAKAKIIHEDNQGIQTLAYPIKKQVTALSYIVQYEAPGTAVEKLEQAYRIDENILRFLSIKVDKHGIAYHKEKRAKAAQADQQATPQEADNASDSAARQSPQAPTEERQKKYCRFTKFGIKYIDYKEHNFLKRFLNPQGKILPRRITGNSAKAQRMVNQAIKRSRHLGRLPFVADNLK